MLSYAQGDQNVSNNMAKMCSLAKAKYDNLAESPDELAFRRGDVLTVVDQKIEGLDGWWLCSFRGRQGIVPANRVTLLAGMYYESALRFSTSPESSISDGGGVDYDIPKTDPQNRKLPPLPKHNRELPKQQTPIRDLVYDIPKSLEKTRIHMSQSNAAHMPNDNVYDTPPSRQMMQLTPAGNIRSSGGPISPPYKSGDSAVDVRSNRSSLASNTSSPPGSNSSRGSREILDDTYDTPNSRKVRQLHATSTASARVSVDTVDSGTGDGFYDVPKTIRETLNEYSRDSGIYDNARLSAIQSSPQKEAASTDDVYDHPVPSAGKSSATFRLTDPTTNDNVYDTPPAGRATRSLTDRLQLIDISSQEKLDLELEAAIEIIVKLQQHVNTSTSRLLGFVHAKWRARANLESVLYDLKIACVGLQTTVQEFYDFGLGALANASTSSTYAVKERMSAAMLPLKVKLDIINSSMKSLSGMKWHIARLEEISGSADDDLMKLVTVAREICNDVSRVASVIHGNSTLLFKSSNTTSSVGSLMLEARKSVAKPTLERFDSVQSYNEYDYCEVQSIDSPIVETKTIPQTKTVDLEQDTKYLRYYSHHAHTICEHVKQHIAALEAAFDEQGVSNEKLVSLSKHVVSTAHKLVYIGDTLSRTLRQTITQHAVSEDANKLCNVLKEFIMNTKEAALAPAINRSTALSKLRNSTTSVQNQANAFQSSLTEHGQKQS